MLYIKHHTVNDFAYSVMLQESMSVLAGSVLNFDNPNVFEIIQIFNISLFFKDEQYYLSLNDLYNWFVIQDSKNKVYVDYGKHTMVYQLNDEVYYIDFGRDEIKYKNDCININENGSHIYISHKNIYLSVYFIEKILLKNEKKIEIENKNAIIS